MDFTVLFLKTTWFCYFLWKIRLGVIITRLLIVNFLNTDHDDIIFSEKWLTSCLFCALHFSRYSSKKFLTFGSRCGIELRLSVLFIQLFLSDLFYISQPIRKVLYLTFLRQIQDLLFYLPISRHIIIVMSSHWFSRRYPPWALR